MKVLLSGDCTVGRAAELKTLLLSSLGRDTELILDFEKVEEADLSFFLVLHSLISTCGKRGKKLTMLANLPEKLAGRAGMAGLAHIVRELKTES